MSWLMEVYECQGRYCYLGEKICSSFPLHLCVIIFLLCVIVGVPIVLLNIHLRRKK